MWHLHLFFNKPNTVGLFDVIKVWKVTPFNESRIGFNIVLECKFGLNLIKLFSSKGFIYINHVYSGTYSIG